MSGISVSIYIDKKLYEEILEIIERASEKIQREYGIKLPERGITFSSVVNMMLRKYKDEIFDEILQEYMSRRLRI